MTLTEALREENRQYRTPEEFKQLRATAQKKYEELSSHLASKKFELEAYKEQMSDELMKGSSTTQSAQKIQNTLATISTLESMLSTFNKDGYTSTEVVESWNSGRGKELTEDMHKARDRAVKLCKEYMAAYDKYVKSVSILDSELGAYEDVMVGDNSENARLSFTMLRGDIISNVRNFLLEVDREVYDT